MASSAFSTPTSAPGTSNVAPPTNVAPPETTPRPPQSTIRTQANGDPVPPATPASAPPLTRPPTFYSSSPAPALSVVSSPLNLSHCVTLRLNASNYLLWKTQFEHWLSSQKLVGHVNGSSPRPPASLVLRIGDNITEAPNPELLVWLQNDQTVLAWLFGSMSEEALRSVYGLHTAAEVWLALARKYNRISASRRFDLQRRLQTVFKDGKSMPDYINEVKTICDQLYSIGCAVDDNEKIYGFIHGLGQEYQAITAVIENAMDTYPYPSFEDIVVKVSNFEDKLQSYASSSTVVPHLAFSTQKTGALSFNNNNNRGRNNSGGRFNSNRGRVSCQICGKLGHPALKCWHRFDNAYQYEDGPSAMAAMRITDVTESSGLEWYPDTGASAYVTSSPQHLQQSQSYAGSDSVMVGNGEFLPITHTGSTTLASTSGTLPLITADYPCSFEFDCHGVTVKDKTTKRVLLSGSSANGLYRLKNQPAQAYFSSRQHCVSNDVWHKRLGHPNKQVLHLLSSNQAIKISTSINRMCESCQLGKSSRLPFYQSSFSASRPLERVHSDLWGPAPVVSGQGFRFYVVFIDHWSRFCWFYPLKYKSDFYATFCVFQHMVENQFNCKIGTFQCDGGGEFTSKMPLKFWVESFFTANFLSNLLPTSALESSVSPFEKLFGKKPDYTSLRVFGCACYPTLRDYSKNKFDPRSLRCIFLGYNDKYKGYRCYLPTTGRVFISRHVIFDEHVYPFATLYLDAHSEVSTPLLQAWQKSFLPATVSSSEQIPSTGSTSSAYFPSAESTDSTSIFVNSDFPPLQRPVSVLKPSYQTIRADQSTRSESRNSGCTAGTDPVPIGNSSLLSPSGTDSSVSRCSSTPVTPASLSVASSPLSTDSSSALSHNSTARQTTPSLPGHKMITRAKEGIFKPNPRYALLTHKAAYPEPRSVASALKHPGWHNAMSEEMSNCSETNTWSLVPRAPGMNILGSKWVFRTKLHADGSLDKLKARLVAKGYNQQEGVDFLETYSPVVRTATVRSVLHLATIMDWDVKQMDVKNAFLHGDLSETVYMTQPTGFEDKAHPDYVCRLNKSLYGLKQSPRAWFDKFSSFLLDFGFVCSNKDPSLFIYSKQKDIILLLLYVDDMVITGSGSCILQSLLSELNKHFRMKDMGQLHYFLGIQARFHSEGLFLSQQKYAEDLLAIAGMTDCSPMPTPLPIQLDRVPHQNELFSNPTYFRSLAGKLQYLTLTRPDIQFAVNYVCQKMHSPTISDFMLLKRILRYIKGTVTMGINFNKGTDCVMRVYSDSDWAGCKETRRSTGGFCTFLGNNIISWSSKKQPTVSKSSTEAEYRTMSEAASEVTWLSSLLKEIGVSIPATPELFCDNLSAVRLTANPTFHGRTKHFELDHHYVRERVALGSLIVNHIPSPQQLAEVFTKSLPCEAFCSLRYKLGVDYPPTPSLRGAINTTKPPAHSEVSQCDVESKPAKELGPNNTKPTNKPNNSQRSSLQLHDKTRVSAEMRKTTMSCKPPVVYGPMASSAFSTPTSAPGTSNVAPPTNVAPPETTPRPPQSTIRTQANGDPVPPATPASAPPLTRPPTFYSSSPAPALSVVSSPLNLSYCVTLRLNASNYLLWKTQFEHWLSSQKLVGHVNGSSPRPPASLVLRIGDNITEAPNPELLVWLQNDQTVLAWLFGSMSEEALRSVYGLHTAAEVWLALARKYNRISASRRFDLQRRLQTVFKDGKSMPDYINEVKTICDQLYSIGCAVDDNEKIYGFIHGLGQEYQAITAVIENAMDTYPYPSFEDIVVKVSNFEDKLQSYASSSTVVPHLAFSTQKTGALSFNNNNNRRRNNSGGRFNSNRGRGSFSTRGRGFPQQISSSNSSSDGTIKVSCQICGKLGHPALKCWHRFDNAYQYEDGPSAMAAMRITDVTESSGLEWYPDTGASAHVTSSPQHLQQSQSYAGSDSVMVGNGEFLPITHTGSTTLASTSGTLPLITADYPCSFEFDCHGVTVKDKTTKRVLLSGSSTNGLYRLKNQPAQAYFSSRQHCVSNDVWHRRLGHPNKQVLHLLSSNQAIKISTSINRMCESCQLGKSSRLPFYQSSFSASRPLERVHSDLWGPAPVVSGQGFRFYVVFIDHWSRFCWFYPLKYKSDFYATFCVFQHMVENQFNCKIGTFQCDGGGEFTSKMPLKFWVESFFTANFLSNLLPTSALESSISPFEKLFGKKPDYTSLRVFGCACYPTLRDYSKNKFDPRSLRCIFLGYNDKYKGYRCYLPTTGRVFISRHVIFDEHVYPFATLYLDAHSEVSTPLLQAWQKSFLPATVSSSEQIPSTGSTSSAYFPSAESTDSTSIFVNSDFPPLQRPVSVLKPSYQTIRADQSTRSESRNSGCTAGTDPVPIGNSSLLSPSGTDSSVSRCSSTPVTPASLSVASSPLSTDSSSALSHNSTARQTTPSLPGHKMITRAKEGIFKPNPRYALLTHKAAYPEPRSVASALKHPGWHNAMSEEMSNCSETNTWSLVPRAPGMNILGSKWVFRTKLHADGSLDKLKARLVAKGYNQQEGVDFLETYSPVVRTATVRSVLHLATIMDWDVKQMDVKNAFLHGDLSETVYMTQPTGFEDKAHPDYVCRLNKSLYGLKQSPRAWFDKFSSFLLDFGFVCSNKDPSLFIYSKQKDIILLLLYVDDMVITGSGSCILQSLLSELNKHFRMKDMGQLHYFLGIQARFHSEGLFLSQQKYAEDLLAIAGMTDCSPMPTPLPIQLDRVPHQNELFSNPTYFRSLAGKLQYLTLTRPDIQFAVNYVCQKMHSPTISDFMLLKRILRYIKGTVTMGINFNKGTDCVMRVYSDSDWAGCKETRRSTGGFCTFLGNNIISWSSKKQPTVSKSSTESEYRTMSEAASEVTWLSSLLKEIGVSIPATPELFCDNLSAVRLTANPTFHGRTKHFELDHHYVRERVALGSLIVNHIPSPQQLADVFTKSLPCEAFCSLRYKLGVDYPPTPSLRGAINTTKPPAHSEVSQCDVESKPAKELGPNNTKPTNKPNNSQRSSLQLHDKTRVSAEMRKTTMSCSSTEEAIPTSNSFGVLSIID
ncbi:uncharacterized protein LOC112086480 [Eutrema salsugineum]|uniref:uncharacterized protein LOC112086480 n=1 Tax=Eutrema salsugineum TaxID=72664 RepID=UPI000CED3CF8|nr:uncharacterized protein LOC112086480 [Eutrema salsugineum]